jgi:hypothetical protein
MSHTQRQLMQQGRRSHAVRGRRPQIEAWIAYQNMVMTAGSARGAERRRLDWFVCSVGGCEPRGLA